MDFVITAIDLYTLGGLATFVFIVLSIAEILRRKEIISGPTSRKLVHILVGNVVLVFPLGFTNTYAALIGPIFFIFFTYLTCPKSPIKKLRLKGVEAGHAFGTVYYSISLTILTLIFFKPDISDQRNIILIASFLPLVWGDGISAIVGSNSVKNGKYYTIFNSKKSLIGSWTVTFASAIAVFLATIVYKVPILTAFYLSLLVAGITTIIEAFSPKGIDNLTIPFVNASILYALYCHLDRNFFVLDNNINWKSTVTALLLSILLAIGGVKFHVLTVDGAMVGIYFGLVILGLGSWTLGSIYGTFFILGSAFTVLGKKRKKEVTKEFEKGTTARDSIQAMINSIVPGTLALILVVYPHPVVILAASAALATSLSDTLGTEIGILSNEKPRLSLKPWKKVEKGHPGAVSLVGIMGSLLGAIIIALVGWSVSIFDSYVNLPKKPLFGYFLFVSISGFLGAYLDSIFAVTIQRLNKCPKCGKITEKNHHCKLVTEYYKGIKWLKNDLINLFSILSGAIFATGAYFLFIS